jgi:hypothetical protein
MMHAGGAKRDTDRASVRDGIMYNLVWAEFCTNFAPLLRTPPPPTSLAHLPILWFWLECQAQQLDLAYFQQL